jgi:hypothetical protein
VHGVVVFVDSRGVPANYPDTDPDHPDPRYLTPLGNANQAAAACLAGRNAP